MEPTIPSVTIDGLHLAFAFGGFAVGLGIGYFYGWLHFGDRPNDARVWCKYDPSRYCVDCELCHAPEDAEEGDEE